MLETIAAGKGAVMENTNIGDIFAKNVFTVGKMRERLPKETFDEFMSVRATAASFH